MADADGDGTEGWRAAPGSSRAGSRGSLPTRLPEDPPRLLAIARRLTGGTRGTLGLFTPDGLRVLAVADNDGMVDRPGLPRRLLDDMRGQSAPTPVTARESDRVVRRLLAPLGPGPEALLAIELDAARATDGQDLLLLAQALGRLIWRCLQPRGSPPRAGDGFASIESCSRLLPVRAPLRAASRSAVPTLLVGEAGTEVERLARYVHDHGARRDGPREELARLDADGAALFSLSDRTRRILTDHCWPGNVDELRQVLAAAAACAGKGEILPRHLPGDLGSSNSGCDEGVEPLAEVERRMIAEALRRLGGNRTRAAAALGIAASTLYEKIKRYELTDGPAGGRGPVAAP